jgi:hypothetical protein
MDIRWNILLKTKWTCKGEKFNSEIFNARASPPKEYSKWWKEIREKYIKMLSSFRTPLDIFEDKYGNGNDKKHSKEREEMDLKNIELCYEGALRSFLQDIKQNYSEDVWKIETN